MTRDTRKQIEAIVKRLKDAEVEQSQPPAPKEDIMLRHKWTSQVIGQEQFINAIEPAIQRHQAQLGDPQRPIGTFLLAGPTGSGKTKSVEALAQALHGDQKCLIRIDCGEFQMEHEVAKLIGAPPGYLGHRETQPALTQMKLNAIASNDSNISIVLLDELEKAHSAFHRLLLGIMDSGRLKLGDNTQVNFNNVIIIATTNLAGDKITRAAAAGVGFVSEPTLRPSTVDARPILSLSARAARGQFAPEFINRLDGIIQFNTLTRTDAGAIAVLELSRAADRPIGWQLDLDMGNEMIEWIVQEGYSVEWGAREIKRAIDRLVMTPLAAYVCRLDKAGLRVTARLVDGALEIRHRHARLEAAPKRAGA